MDRERVSEALDRIERAFARLEAVAARGAAAPRASAIVHQNMHLHETVDAALGEIDALIERLGG